MTAVQVRYFAGLREQRDCDEEQVNIASGETVGALYQRLFPPGPEGSMPVMYAVNQEYVRPNHSLQGGEEVAFIPPLGGG